MKDSVKRMRRQTTHREKIFAIYTSDKELLAKIYKELLKISNRNPNIPIFIKWTKDLNRYLTKENIQMANKYMKRCSTLYVIREMEIKTMRYRYMSIKIATIQNTDNTKYW